MRNVHIVSVAALLLCAAGTAQAQYDASPDYGLNEGVARFQQQQMMNQLEYNNWFNSLSSRYQQIEQSMSGIYNDHFYQSNGGSIPPTQENIVLIAQQLEADQSEMSFITQRMQERYASAQQANRAIDRIDRTTKNVCDNMRMVGVELPGC